MKSLVRDPKSKFEPTGSVGGVAVASSKSEILMKSPVNDWLVIGGGAVSPGRTTDVLKKSSVPAEALGALATIPELVIGSRSKTLPVTFSVRQRRYSTESVSTSINAAQFIGGSPVRA